MTNKLVILLKTENGKTPKYAKEFSTYRVNPLKLLDDNVHNLKKIYKDTFKNDKLEAKELLENILLEQNNNNPLIFKLVEKLNLIDNETVIVNSALLSANDRSFLASLYNNIAFLSPIKTPEGTAFVFTSTLTDEVDVFSSKEEVITAIDDTVKKIYGTDQ